LFGLERNISQFLRVNFEGMKK